MWNHRPFHAATKNRASRDQVRPRLTTWDENNQEVRVLLNVHGQMFWLLLMAHLSQSLKEAVVFVQQKYEANCMSWNIYQRQETVYRMNDFYYVLGVQPFEAQEFAQTAVASNDAPTLSTDKRNALNRLIFDRTIWFIAFVLNKIFS